MKSILTFIRGLFFNAIAPLQNFTFVQWASVVLTVCSAIMAYGDRQQSIPWLPGNLAHYWPMVLAAAGAISRYGHIFLPQATVYTPAQLQQAVTAHLSSMTGQAQIQAAVTQAANSPAK